MTDIYLQSNPETIRELKTSLWNAEISGGVANLTGAFTTAFEILHRVSLIFMLFSYQSNFIKFIFSTVKPKGIQI